MHDLNKVLKLLSGYLVKDDSGKYYFSHSSVRDWLQDEESDFFCDVLNGHSIMANYNLKTLKVKYPSPGDFFENVCFRAKLPYPTALLDLKFFSLRYLFHSSESGSSNVNVLISELGIKAIDLLHAAFRHSGDAWDCSICSEYMAMKVLDETDVLNKMTIQEKAEHLELALVWNYARITAKLFDSRTYWIFSRWVIIHLNCDIKLLQLVPKESMPQLFFSFLVDIFFRNDEIFEFCVKNGLTADVCVPQFFENTKGFDSSICWNEDVQEYFRKLKSGEENVITLESLKEKPFYPEEAKVSEFTLEIIQKPLSEIERLLRDGMIYVEFKYGWHSLLPGNSGFLGDRKLQQLEKCLKHGANPSNRGGPAVTALMLTCKNLNDLFVDSTAAEQVVSLLLDHGAEVNQQDFYGRTALHYAFEARYNTEEGLARKQRVVQILIQHNVDVHESWLITDEAALRETCSKKGKTYCSIS
ncbi:ankyrin repeat [Paramuricea clavata]|uniref:Ankyrin repeat n=1 Tax=Paramuricea clavata TaxID=317549 RepID=A0A7D9EWV8_PARCT|nr:ankyrin repeat [Paramuricea clavata]